MFQDLKDESRTTVSGMFFQIGSFFFQIFTPSKTPKKESWVKQNRSRWPKYCKVTLSVLSTASMETLIYLDASEVKPYPKIWSASVVETLKDCHEFPTIFSELIRDFGFPFQGRGCCRVDETVSFLIEPSLKLTYRFYTWKSAGPKRKRCYSNHLFSGANC